MLARTLNRAWRQGRATPSPPPTSENRQLAWSLLEPQPEPEPRCGDASRIENDYGHFALLGKGGFGVVYSATSRIDGRACALKLVPKHRDAEAEARCMASLPAHDHLVRYMSAWSEPLPVAQLRRALEAERSSERAAVAHLRAAWLLPAIVDEEDDEEDDEEGSTEGSSVGSGGRGGADLPSEPPSTLCLQLELCPMPTLQAVLEQEMSCRAAAAIPASSCSSSAARATSSPPFFPLEASSSWPPAGHSAARPPPPAASATSATSAVPAFPHVPEWCVPETSRWRWVAGLARGLEAVHAAGWLHNDVKPANIFCAADGAVKLADFGLASPLVAAPRLASSRAPLGLSSSQTTLATSRVSAGEASAPAGTPLYMPPERQAPPPRPPAGPPSDVYALGVCVAEVHGGFSTAMERAAVLHRLKARATDVPLDAEREGDGQVGGSPISPAWESLALGMIAVRPEERLSLCEVERVADMYRMY